jgi:hypothetical protein
VTPAGKTSPGTCELTKLSIPSSGSDATGGAQDIEVEQPLIVVLTLLGQPVITGGLPTILVSTVVFASECVDDNTNTQPIIIRINLLINTLVIKYSLFIYDKS